MPGDQPRALAAEQHMAESALGTTSSSGPFYYSKYSRFEAGKHRKYLSALLKTPRDALCRYKLNNPIEKLQSPT